MKNTAWIAIASLALTTGLSACKGNGTASTAPPGSTAASAAGMPAPVTATWRPADKTTEFLSAFRPQE